MPEFTASDPGSSFPNQNILFNSASGITGQQIQQNQLGLQGQQMQLTAADHEQVGRLAAGLLNEPDLGKRADLYSRGVGMLQSQGLAKYAPPTLPDESTLRSLVSQTIPAQTQAEWLQNLTANKAYINAGNPPAAPTAAAPGATPSGGTGPAPFVGANLPAGVSADEDQLVRTVYGEAGGEPVAGQQAVAHVIKTRMGLGKQGVQDVVFAPNQFEAWSDPKNRPRMEALDPSSPQYQAILNNVVRPVISGQAQDPTGGATNFYNPALQAQLGRSTPGFAQGNQTTIGNHTFFYGGYAPRGTVTASAAPATAQPGQPVPTQIASNTPMVSTAPAAPTAAPGGPTAAAPAPGATTQPPTPAQSGQPQPQVSPAGGPPPPQTPVLNANGLTDLQQRQINAIAANPKTKQGAVVAAQQAFVTQNIQQRQQAFADYMQQQQLAVSQGTLSNAQAETNLKYWQAQHPELAPNARVQTLAYRTLQELAPVVRQGNATQDVIDKYNNAATEYQEFKEVTDPVTKQLKSVPTRPLPPGYPEPTGTGASGGVRTLTEGLSPSQQQVERDPAAYKVSESQYDRDSKEIAAIGDAGRQSQADQVRVKEMQDVLQKFNSGRGTEAATAAAAWFNSWAPAGLTGWKKESENLSGSQAAEAFSKLALVGAGTQERGVLGARGGYQAIKLFKEANPNINLQDATNKSILDMQLISNQANADYSQAALSHFADNEKKFSATHQYDSLAQFDRNWNGQRNPQVYAAAMGAIAGQPPSQWTKGLSDDEYARALQIVQRAKPSAVVQTKNGPYSMQPNAVTTGTSAAPGTKVIRFDHNGNQIQ